MSPIKTKRTRKLRRIKLSNRNKIEYLHNQLKKMKAVKTELVEQLDEKEEEWNLEKKKVNDLKKTNRVPRLSGGSEERPGICLPKWPSGMSEM